MFNQIEPPRDNVPQSDVFMLMGDRYVELRKNIRDALLCAFDFDSCVFSLEFSGAFVSAVCVVRFCFVIILRLSELIL